MTHLNLAREFFTPERLLDTYQDQYAIALQSQWSADQSIILEYGIPPPWWKNGGELDSDEARIMTLIADNICMAWSDTNKQLSRPIIRAMGFAKQSNCSFVICKLRDSGLIEFRGVMMYLTAKGQMLLDMHELDCDDEYTVDVMIEPENDVIGGMFL